ncbi:hypothetical protein [Longitalea luteola]|nr:hypothetical protein [Longitalea luteola]
MVGAPDLQLNPEMILRKASLLQMPFEIWFFFDVFIFLCTSIL